jgi:hypothetical protein
VQRPLDLAAPEIEEPGQLREIRRQVQLLPDEGLQQAMVVRHVVKDFGGGQVPVGQAQVLGADEAFEAMQHAQILSSGPSMAPLIGGFPPP